MDSLPEQISKYRVMEEVGRGGMAVVYRGYDQTLDRQVAIKVLHPHLATDADSRVRFQREARAVARLHHPHIIEIFDFADRDDGPSYIVTEFIEGETLKAFIERHRLFFPEIAVMIAIQLCEAVGHAHKLQIIHRDLKPENVMVDRQGSLKLMDFGIAKVLDHEQQMTLTGSILGSPAHMAPELLEGKELDFRSDVFSIGTVLYWLATGQLPFTGKNPHQVLRAILEGRFPDPRRINPQVGEPLAAVITRALAHDPAERYPSASAMLSSLHGLLADLEISDIDSELRYFFSEPVSYADKLKHKVEALLLRRGRERLASKKVALALQDFDRLLALQPAHAEVLALVNGIQRGQRRRKRLAIGGAIACACLLALGVWKLLPEPVPGSPDAGLFEPVPPPDAGSAYDAGAIAAEPDGAQEPAQPADAGAESGPGGDRASVLAPGDARRVVVAPRDPGPADPPLPRHPVRIVSEPYFERILINGALMAKADHSNAFGQIFEASLPVGRHTLVIQRQSCQDDEFEIVVPRTLPPGGLEFRRQLRFLPASLAVDSEVPEAAVWVDGVFKGTAQDSLHSPIVITLEGRQGRRTVRVRLESPDGRRLEREVQLEAGGASRMVVRSSELTRPGGKAP